MPCVFITGAVKNTGYAIAEKFASHGYDVAISSRTYNALNEAVNKLKSHYDVKVKGYVLNLSDVEDIKRVFAYIEQDFGRLDVFVPNAANLGVDCDMQKVIENDYDDVIDVNLKGTYFCCQQAALIMCKQKKGSIVIISSVHSKACIWGRSLYAMSKGGLNALMRSMAIEFAPYGIRTNCIIAGQIRTDRWDKLTSEQIEAKRQNWPVGEESTGDDIANGVFYLGTDLSRTVSGTELTIDSGILATLLPYHGGRH